MSKSRVRAFATGLVLFVWSAVGLAAGLGKLTVLSSLGQPFLAEIDLVAVKKEELASLSARLAPPDAFRQADVPYTAYVSNLKLSIEKRANGDSYVKVASAQPLNEPFIDFLVELGWTSGRLVRAYTALVDPPVVTEPAAQIPATEVPEVRAAPAERVAEPPAAAPEGEAPTSAAPLPEASVVAEGPTAPVQPALGAREQTAPVTQVPEPAEQWRGAAAGPRAGPATQAGAEVITKRGDTLSEIALANKPADVTLDQMLVMLFRSNPDAFSGANMNRLKTGKVLRIPEAREVAALSSAEARREVRVQAANWNAYRERLAALAGEGPATEGPAARSAAGAITTTVEDKAAPPAEQPSDVLKLSKGEPAKGAAAGDKAGDAKGAQARIQSLEEELAAKEKAVRDANDRIAQLEKTIKDMQSLMDIKSKGMTEPQAAPGAAVTTATVPAAPSGEPAPAPAAPGGESAPAAPAAESAGQAPAQPQAGAPATVSGSGPAPKPKFVPPPPAPAPSLVDQILAEPLYLAGGAAVLVALGGLAFMSWKRRKGAASPARAEAAPAKEAVGTEERFERPGPLTVVAGGAAAAGAEAGEEGDPLAEAEIFLTYGRDNLAEERLKEAIAANPARFELHAKLLEIYAKRKDTASFEQVAKELQVGTGGKGELWNQAVRLGYQIDPSNPRYAAGRPAEGEDLAKTVIAGGAGLAAAAPLEADKTNLDFNLGFEESTVGATTDLDLGNLGAEIGAVGAAATHTDIDLGDLGGAEAGTDSIVLDPGVKLPGAENVETVQMGMLEGTSPAAEGSVASEGLDFDFDLTGMSPPATPGATADGGTAEPQDFALDLNLDGLSIEPPQATRELPMPGPDLDLSGISLDLGGEGQAAAPASAKDDRWYDVQTKFDLAKAYQEMGDREGAREILQEVISEGDDEQKAAAQAALATLA